MSRSNTGSTSNYFSNTSAVVTAAPLTYACWFYPSDLTADSNLINIGISSTNYFSIFYDGANDYGAGARAVGIETAAASTYASAMSPTAPNGPGWVHCAGVFESSTSRTAYMNGRPGTTNTTSRTPSGINRTNVGLYNDGIGGLYGPMFGAIAHVCVWNVALSTAEIVKLARGGFPMDVKRQNLVAYWPMQGVNSSRELDIIGRQQLTLNGTMPPTSGEPLIYVPRNRNSGWMNSISAGGGFQAAWARGSNSIVGRAGARAHQ